MHEAGKQQKAQEGFVSPRYDKVFKAKAQVLSDRCIGFIESLKIMGCKSHGQPQQAGTGW